MKTASAISLLVATAACSGGASDATLSVFAASSLAEVCADLERAFERDHAGVDVTVVTAGSQILRVQIEQGAPAHVFASANAEHVAALVGGGFITAARPFAGNRLVIVTPASNPAAIRGVADLVRAERIVLGTEQVPVGAYARVALAHADTALGGGFLSRVMARVVSEEANARLVLAKVQLGEADAAIVYETDARVAQGISTFPIPDELAPRPVYSVGVVSTAPSPQLADAWVASLFEPAGREALLRRGFEVPN